MSIRSITDLQREHRARARANAHEARRFPWLCDLIASGSVSTGGIRRSLTKQQADAQDEIRSIVDGAPYGGGIIMPFYEQRAMSATGTTSTTGDQGGNAIATDVPEIGSAFRAAFDLEKYGARVFGGLVGNANFPSSKPGLVGASQTENAGGSEATELFQQLGLSPKRITAYLDVSVQNFLQSSQMEGYLRTELSSAIAAEVQRQVINGAGTGNEILGILNTSGIASVAGGTNGAAPTWANLQDLVYAVSGTGKADRGNLGWITSPKIRRKLQNTLRNPSGAEISAWNPDKPYELMGFPASVTTASPDTLTKGTASGTASAIAFLEFSELIVGFWGAGIEVEIARSVALAKLGQVRVIATAYVDAGLRQPTGCAAMLDALTA